MTEYFQTSQNSSCVPDPTLASLLDATEATLAASQRVYQAMRTLFAGLQALLERAPEDRERLRAQTASHPLATRLRECPFTRCAEEKRRGYPGDAEIIDFLYEHSDNAATIASASGIGRRILAHNLDAVAAAAVRNRRRVLSSAITEVARARRGAEILAVACGHARELESVDETTRRAIGRFVAFDQDEHSLARIAGLARDGVRLETVCAKVSRLVRRRDLAGLDLVYAAGLYDYLNEESCRKLTRALFSRLRPGGRLIVANFLAGQPDQGYMELVTDWCLVYRDRAEIEAFAAEIDRTEIASVDYFVEPANAIGFLELVRR